MTRIALVLCCALAAACGPKSDKASPTPPPAAPTKPTAGAKPDVKPGEGGPRGIPRIEDLPADDNEVANLPAMISRLNLRAYHERGYRGQNVRIAVLDNGFAGLSKSLGKRLPPGLAVETAPRPDMQNTSHGTKLAEIAYGLATGSNKYVPGAAGPEILLYNTSGFTNLKAAIDGVIAKKVDIVLYAQVWEYGGNGDGEGFINREVSRATSAGILWVNAAGNFGEATFGGKIELASDGITVKLPYQEKFVRFTVPQDGTPTKVVLSWNDFDESKDYRTSQDLDLIVYDEAGNEIGAGRLAQEGTAPVNGSLPAGASAHARELVSTALNAGTYLLKVEARSRNFDDHSRLRLTIDGMGIRMLDHSSDDVGVTSILIPADNPTVLAVGAIDAKFSAAATLVDGRHKPEISVFSEVIFSDGQSVNGTSAATAIAVGAMSVFYSAYGKPTGGYAEVMRWIDSGKIAIQDTSVGSGATPPRVLRLPEWQRL